jgi:hypothetical protein
LTDSKDHLVVPEYRLLANVHVGEGTHLTIRTTSEVVQIVPTLYSKDSFFLKSLFVAAAVTVLWIMGYRPPAFWEPGGDAILYVALAGLLICFVKSAIDTLRFLYLRSRSPLLAYDAVKAVVRIHGHKNPIPRSAVRGLAFVSLRAVDGEFQSEIQLIAEKNHSPNLYFICSVMSQSIPRQYGLMLSDFSKLTGIPVWVVDSFSVPDNEPPAVSRLDEII